jgi:hypothetical protein
VSALEMKDVVKFWVMFWIDFDSSANRISSKRFVELYNRKSKFHTVPGELYLPLFFAFL